VGVLAREGRAAADFLRRRLGEYTAPDPGRVRQLLADLADGRFAVRQRATAELTRHGKFVEPAVRAALAGKHPLETRRRLEQVLAAITASGAGWLRGVRGVEALERMGTAEAHRVLTDLADGPPRTWLTLEAQAALRRLEGAP
jgi:hypothetical protein